MKLTLLASTAYAFVSAAPSLITGTEGASVAPEPLWLVVWGAALIAFSSTVRARTRARHEAPDPEPGRLAVIAASLARSA